MMDHSIVWLRAASVLLALFAAYQMAGFVSSAGRAREGKERRNGGVIRYEGLPLPLIVDGKVQDGNLEKIGQTRFWLKNRVQEMGVRKFREVAICTIDHRGKLYLRFYDFTAKTN